MKLILLTLLAIATSGTAADKIKVLIVDGQNNHNWKMTGNFFRAELPTDNSAGPVLLQLTNVAVLNRPGQERTEITVPQRVALPSMVRGL